MNLQSKIKNLVEKFFHGKYKPEEVIENRDCSAPYAPAGNIIKIIVKIDDAYYWVSTYYDPWDFISTKPIVFKQVVKTIGPDNSIAWANIIIDDQELICV